MADKENTPEDAGMEATEIPVEHVEAGPVDDTSPAAPTKRGRGRPPKNGGEKTTAAKPQKTAGKKAADVDAFAKQLCGIHMLAAMATGLPELQISEPEGAMLAKGISAVCEEYGLSVDGKTGAALQLFGAAAMVYVPRYFAINAKMQAAKKAREAEQAVDINPAPSYAYGGASVN